MQLRKNIGPALIALALVGTAAACAPGSSPSASSSNQASPTTVDFNSFKGKSLTYMYFSDGAPDLDATKAAIASFEKETGASVNLQIVPFGNLNQTLQARVSAGNAPEVARVADWHPYASQLSDFNQYFGADYSAQFNKAMASMSKDANGRFLSVPSDLTINGPFINVDAFTKAGVPVPTKWTWPELVDAATKVAKANNMQYPLAIDKSGNRLSTVLSQYGTVMIGNDGKNALNKEKATAALTFFTDLVKNDTISRDFWLGAGSKYTGANQIFLAQQAPVYLSGPWQVGAFATTASFKWAAVPNPCQERCGGFPGGKQMVAFKSSKEPTLAVAFVEWMNRTANQTTIDQGAFWQPTRQDLIASGIQYPKRGDDMAVFLAETKQTPDDTYGGFAPPFTQSATALITETDNVVAGKEPVSAAVDNLSAAIDKAVAAAK